MMKKFFLARLAGLFFLFFMLSAEFIHAQARSYWVCCSPYGYCDLRRYDAKYKCQANCGRTGYTCELKSIEEIESDLGGPIPVLISP